MDFLSTPLWWAFFVAASISFAVYQLGRLGEGLWKQQLQTWGALFTMVFVVLAFVFSGWKGGIAVVLGMTLSAVVGFQAIMRIFRSR